jgi:hypothetical protein
VQADIVYTLAITSVSGTSSGLARITTSGQTTVNWSGFVAAEVGVYQVTLTGTVTT